MHLRKINLEDEIQLREVKNEYLKQHNTNQFEGIKFLQNFENINDLINKLYKFEKFDNSFKNEISQTTYVLADNENYIYGFITLRIGSSDVITNELGNIGYSIRPSQRNKKYGSLILKLGLDILNSYSNKIIITCRKSNIISRNVIKNNGGILYREEYKKDYDDILQFFEICNEIEEYKSYSDYFEKDKYWEKHINKKIEEDMWLDKYVKYLNKGKALDLGCGIGQYSKKLMELGYSVVSSDISEIALSEVSKFNKNILKLNMLDKFPFENEKFDLVLQI